MPSSCGPADRTPCTNSGMCSAEFLRVRLAVIPALEASLHRSREALLAMDLDGIGRGTGEQVGLIRQLKEAAQSETLSGGNRQPQENRKPLVSASPVSVSSAELEELRRSENRVHEAARLQAALLARGRYKLRVLANMLGGLSKTYRPG
jgi:hypothetical protein